MYYSFAIHCTDTPTRSHKASLDDRMFFGSKRPGVGRGCVSMGSPIASSH